MSQIDNSGPKYIKVKEEDKVENIMTDTTMIRETIRVDTNQIVEPEESVQTK